MDRVEIVEKLVKDGGRWKGVLQIPSLHFFAECHGSYEDCLDWIDETKAKKLSGK